MQHPVQLEHVRLLIPFVLHARLTRHLDEAVALNDGRVRERGGGGGGVNSVVLHDEKSNARESTARLKIHKVRRSKTDQISVLVSNLQAHPNELPHQTHFKLFSFLTLHNIAFQLLTHNLLIFKR